MKVVFPICFLMLVGCVAATTPIPMTCADAITDCESYGTSACHGVYKQWGYQNCKSFCGLCGDVNPTAPLSVPQATCHDKLSICAGYGKGMCQLNSKWATHYCAKYCDLCNVAVPSSKPYIVLEVIGCQYHGVTYAEGAIWQDGCQLTCECVNGHIGEYHCTLLCPTWNVPDVCHFEDPAPGKCCKVPRCPASANVTFPAEWTEV